MSTIAQLFVFLKTYGDKLGPALVVIQEMIDAWMKGAQKLADLFGGNGPFLTAEAAPQLTAQEAKLEAEVIAMAEAGMFGAEAVQAGFFLNLIALIKANPWLAELLLLFLKKQAAA